MNAPVFTRSALADLQEIWSYIGQDNVSAADALEMEFYEAATEIAAQPSLGHRRKDLTDQDVWFLSVRKKYLLVYRKAEPVEIVRVLHGARDLRTLFEE